MVTKKVIDTIYKTCKRRPASPEELDIALLFEQLPLEHDIGIDGDSLITGSIPESSPFHSLPLGHIHGIIDFDDCVAVALHSSIVFLDKETDRTSVHIRQERPSIIDRLRYNLSNPEP